MSDTPQVLSACPGQLSKVHLQSRLAVTHPPMHVIYMRLVSQQMSHVHYWNTLMYTQMAHHTVQCDTAHRRHVGDAWPAIVVVASGMHTIASETTMATTAIPLATEVLHAYQVAIKRALASPDVH